MESGSFSHLLRQHRIAASLSQEALAERSGVSVDAISALERGARQAPYKTTLDLLIAGLALDENARTEIEEAATLARARGVQAQRVHSIPNLPPQLTSFVNRETLVADLKELLQSHRLVTLVGTGGAGKTRCALKVATEMFDAYRDGVWLAEFAPITDPSRVAGVIARALRLHEAPNRPILDTLLGYLKRKRLLLILDNCEHVIDEARHVVSAILHSCPGVHILATSRENFTIEGEQRYRIPSLAVPETSDLLSAEEMSQYGAVKLFTDRAISADNHFALSIESAPHVAEICRRLDGIPLAVELAAARVRTLSPKELAQKLDERLSVLTGGDRSAPSRHQTMRALIDWSYDLLSDNERQLFRKLSIFADTFSLDAASAVCSGQVADEIATLDTLSSLIDKSLVQAEPVGDGMRYRLLESVRQYGRERLAQAGEYETVARAHANAFLGISETLDRAWETTPDYEWWARVDREFENIREALTWSLRARGDVPLGQRLAGALLAGWVYLSAAEGRRWVQLARDLGGPETPAPVAAALDFTETAISSALSQHKASRAAGQRALTHDRGLLDPFRVAYAEAIVGHARVVLGDVAQGQAMLTQALAEARGLGARRLTAFTLSNFARARVAVGDVDSARPLFAEALTIFQAMGAVRYGALTGLWLAEAEFYGGNVPEALRLADDALGACREHNDTRNVGLALRNIAAYLIALERYDEARISSREALAASRDTQHDVSIACAVQHIAAIAARQPADATKHVEEDRVRAARLLGYVDARLRALEVFREYTDQQEYDKVLAVLRKAFSADRLASLMSEGSDWGEDHAVAEAMLV